MKYLDHNVEAEQALLGALLIDEGAYDSLDALHPEWFYLGAHQEIARVIVGNAQARKPFDVVSIHSALKEQHKSPDPVPVDLVWNLQKGLGTAANARHYASVVKNTWALRQARIIASSFADNLDVSDAEVAIAALQRDLSGIETGNGSRIVSIADVVMEQQLALEAENEKRPGTDFPSTGFAALDELTAGFEPGILQLYAARPGQGKSALAVAFARALGEAGIPTAVFWLEDTARKFGLRLSASIGGIPALDLRHGKYMKAQHWEKLLAVGDKVAKMPLYVESAKGLTGTQLCARMRRLKREKGIRVFIADHLGEVAIDRKQHGDRTDLALGEVAKMYRDEAERLGAAPVAFHQLGQKSETETGGPRLGWLFNSDVLGQAGRVIGFLSRDGCTAKIVFPKVTYGPVGSVVTLGWDGDLMQIFQPIPDQGSLGV